MCLLLKVFRDDLSTPAHQNIFICDRIRPWDSLNPSEEQHYCNIDSSSVSLTTSQVLYPCRRIFHTCTFTSFIFIVGGDVLILVTSFISQKVSFAMVFFFTPWKRFPFKGSKWPKYLNESTCLVLYPSLWIWHVGGHLSFCCHHALSFYYLTKILFSSLTTVTVSRMACKYLYNSVIRTVFSVLQKLAMSVSSTFRLVNPSMLRKFCFTVNTQNIRKQRANLASTFL